MTKRAVRLTLEVKEGLDEPLAVIGDIVESSRGIETSLREWVRIAREHGHSWREIAEALGVTRQSAWERFKVVDEERPDAISRAMGALAGRGLPSTDEMRRQAREEDAEIEERKWGSNPQDVDRRE